MEEIEQVNLSAEFGFLINSFPLEDSVDERGIQRVFVRVLRILGMAYERKFRIQQQLASLDPLTANYEQMVVRLVSKGFAFEERKKWMELQSGGNIRNLESGLREVELLIEACKRYESLLNGILTCHKLGLKLAFEGHE